MTAPASVRLSHDHPGFADASYRTRRNQIAQLAHAYVAGGDIPRVAYSDSEHQVWSEIWRHLTPLHRSQVATPVRALIEQAQLPHDHIPQLADISVTLKRQTGFRLAPVPGLVPARQFLIQLADSEFLSTQYVRHASRPLYTPEPDVVHELVGHATTLADDRLARINRRFGAAALVADEATTLELIRVYWYALEFGVCREDGVVKAVGAGLLSSAGELARMAGAQLRQWDLEVMAESDFDTQDYQPGLFVAPSYAALLDDVERWLDGRTPNVHE